MSEEQEKVEKENIEEETVTEEVEDTKENEPQKETQEEVIVKEIAKDQAQEEEKKKHHHDNAKKKHHDKEKNKPKKETSYLKVLIIAIISAVIIALLIVGILCLFKKEPESQEIKLENRLKELAKDFYEEKYYPNLVSSKTNEPMTEEEKKEFAAKYEQTGITMGLESLARTFGEDKDKILKEFVNEETKEACSPTETQIIIYPKRPYDVKSYEIEVKLACGFKEK